MDGCSTSLHLSGFLCDLELLDLYLFMLSLRGRVRPEARRCLGDWSLDKLKPTLACIRANGGRDPSMASTNAGPQPIYT